VNSVAAISHQLWSVLQMALTLPVWACATPDITSSPVITQAWIVFMFTPVQA
jgi:hypothetical protein